MVKNILNRIRLDGNWVSVNLGNFNDCYVIAIKNQSGKKDTVNPDEVKILTFEIGIDSGIKGSPISISRFSLNFNETSSSDVALDKITAFTRLLNIPSDFYLRAVSIDNGAKSLNKGETSISININPVNLG